MLTGILYQSERKVIYVLCTEGVKEPMPWLSREVRAFISACETIQALLAQGGTLTHDENEIIEMSAIDLLSKLTPQQNSSHKPSN